jgi:hypothetical protein
MGAGPQSLSDVIQNALPTWLGGSPVTASEAAANDAAATAQITAVGNSVGASVPVHETVDNDTNLVNGQTYTFSFQAQPGVTVASLQADIAAQAPGFIMMFSVVQGSGSSQLFFNVTFTYEGDGSDVVTDVASAIVAAAFATNGDGLAFLQASQQKTVGQVLQPVIGKQVTAATVDQTGLANQANAAAKAQDTAQLTSIIIWAAIGLGAFLVVYPKILKATTP